MPVIANELHTFLEVGEWLGIPVGIVVLLFVGSLYLRSQEGKVSTKAPATQKGGGGPPMYNKEYKEILAKMAEVEPEARAELFVALEAPETQRATKLQALSGRSEYPQSVAAWIAMADTDLVTRMRLVSAIRDVGL
jgi:hypothetical protein